MGDQLELCSQGFDGGPMRTVYPGLYCGTNEMGD